jgi:glycosyltransferase involved in cell wall biosynthesis
VRNGPIAINARAAVRSEIGGVERLAREMAARLPRLRPDRYRVIAPPPWLSHRAGHAWEQGALPLRTWRSQLVYSPANLAPVLSGRNVVVVHDAAALRHPEAYSRSYVEYQRVVLPWLARHARLVITVSEFSRQELIEVLGASPERVRVVAPGVDKRFGPSADPGSARTRLGLSRPYVLAVGTRSARKNLGALTEPARALRGRGIELVVAGSDRSYLRAPADGLRRLGYVEEADLPGLYAGALALVMPSVYEGFGLPCLEAMAVGTPVVISPYGALPETCGEAALVADPGRPSDFAEAVLAAACDDAARATLIAAGPARAAGFSWERTVELTDAVLGRLLGRV